MKSVELHQAFSWICDGCGKRNFERAIESEMSPEDEMAEKEKFGIDPGEEGMFLMAPRGVKCKHCDEEYEVLLGE